MSYQESRTPEGIVDELNNLLQEKEEIVFEYGEESKEAEEIADRVRALEDEYCDLTGEPPQLIDGDMQFYCLT